MNRHIAKEMHVNLVKYYVYQQLKADEYKANLYMAMLHFEESWNLVPVNDFLRYFENGY